MVGSLVYVGEVLGDLYIGSLLVIIDLYLTLWVSLHHSGDYWVTPLYPQYSISKLIELLHLVTPHQFSQSLYIPNLIELSS